MTVPAAPAHPPLPQSLLDELSQLLGNRFSTSASVREHHGSDISALDPMPPDAVAYANSLDDIVAISTACYRHDVPMIAYGSGTSLEGWLQASHGGISIDVSGMDQIVQIRVDDMDVTVQPGVTRKQLNAALHGTGLFFPIDPGADASLGGMAATRASGTNAVRYGTMRENVMGMTAVLADGRVIHTGGRARKSSAGYDLTHLLVGSGGTLATIAELTVKLHPIPEAISAAVCRFPTVDHAVRAVIQTIQLGVPIARIELLDALTMQALNAYSKTQLREAPSLFFELHGSEASVKEQIETVRLVADEQQGLDFEWAVHPEDRSRLWQARHDAYFAALALRPGCRSLTTDAVVPISRLAECIETTAADLAENGFLAPIFGHVGDGNFHALILVDPHNPDEVERAEAVAHRLAERAIAMGGSCTGEHGIGLTKQHFMAVEHGANAVDVMQAIKAALDPKQLMNPGKIFPRGHSAG
ncbi:FAD-linked oxidase C-terminal domain-containing protein [Pseudomonas sp. Bout1]|uniref:FAD-binding oxidoreductase n=1 Tax=Pseudomonas sp. Bout1 TaxID=3048600 RepID=UPI002AB3CA1A|nr:FAD-linked oxidase C-terminal domain-containing protein [Pseudomonas sp. Bout1]MDY7532154.1 FAD-linked oxidase C-terminal domain-containing protein [Pseudomonas sp. Bout1]MEB0188837.1 FAD-linked oxidase C-terminal domain-containing protein [Pseudomonas sp. Bout1]